MSENLMFMPTGNPDLEVIEDFHVSGRLVKDAEVFNPRESGPLVELCLAPLSSDGDRQSGWTPPADSLRVLFKVSWEEEACLDLKQGTAVYAEGPLFRLTRPDQNGATLRDLWLSADRIQVLEQQIDQRQEMELERD